MHKRILKRFTLGTTKLISATVVLGFMATSFHLSTVSGLASNSGLATLAAAQSLIFHSNGPGSSRRSTKQKDNPSYTSNTSSEDVVSRTGSGSSSNKVSSSKQAGSTKNSSTNSAAALSSASSSSAATNSASVSVPTAPTSTQPSYPATEPPSFSWDGYTWDRRSWAGLPTYNGEWNPANVVGPNSSNQVTLLISNPTGSSPYSAEFDSEKEGWGYGTYTVVVDSRLDTLNKSLVFGNMFIYDSGVPISDNEIDAGEYSAWGDAANAVTLSHTLWGNVGGVRTPFSDYINASSDGVTTHQIIWTPSSVTINSYSGNGTSGPVLLHDQWTTNIPLPASEEVMFNFWVTDENGGSPSTVPASSVILQSFTFTPYN